MNVRALVILMLLAACKKEPAPPPADSDARDQYALVKQIVGARDGDAEASFASITRSWIGKRYTWEVAVLPPLCRAPAECYVVPFDHAKSGDQIVQGWLPSLELDPEAHGKLIESCKAHASCVLRFEGTMSILELSPGLPTRVGFKEVKVLGTRAATAEERWGRRIRK